LLLRRGAFTEILRTTIDAIDIVATHHAIEEVAVESIDLESIDATQLRFVVSGNIGGRPAIQVVVVTCTRSAVPA
jgi:hypothetical protein